MAGRGPRPPRPRTASLGANPSGGNRPESLTFPTTATRGLDSLASQSTTPFPSPDTPGAADEKSLTEFRHK